jgi:4,5-dihydroxyphthalate decarboxylase
MQPTNEAPDMSQPTLTTVTRTQGNNEALKTGAVTPEGFSFAFEEVPVLVHAFRRMVRGLEFDVSEMAFTTYLCAKAHGTRFTALPVFLVRGFHHEAILVSAKAGITHPKDLEGKRVGVNRGYTVTTGVWARGILQRDYGVDLDSITWVLSGDEHVADYRPPANVVPVEPGRDLAEMVADGELAAVIGVTVDHPDVVPLVPNAADVGLAALRQRGLYPINHLVVVKDDLLATRPQLAAQVFDAFAEAKNLYVQRLRRGDIATPTATDRMYQQVLQSTGQDPLPYGIAPNRAMIDELMDHAVSQHILDAPIPVEEAFASSTLDRVA